MNEPATVVFRRPPGLRGHRPPARHCPTCTRWQHAREAAYTTAAWAFAAGVLAACFTAITIGVFLILGATR